MKDYSYKLRGGKVSFLGHYTASVYYKYYAMNIYSTHLFGRVVR